MGKNGYWQKKADRGDGFESDPIDDEGSCYEPGEPYNDSFDREMANEPFTEDEKEQMEERLHYSLEELSMNRQCDPKS